MSDLFDLVDRAERQSVIRPQVLTPEEVEFDDVVWECPHCGYRGVPDDFDVLGADEDCVFCNGCNRELYL